MEKTFSNVAPPAGSISSPALCARNFHATAGSRQVCVRGGFGFGNFEVAAVNVIVFGGRCGGSLFVDRPLRLRIS